MHILCAIGSRPVRLGQLVRELPPASKRVLTENLRELEVAGLVYPVEILAALYPHVEYDFNDEMRPTPHAMLDHLADFGCVAQFSARQACKRCLKEDLRRTKRPQLLSREFAK